GGAELGGDLPAHALAVGEGGGHAGRRIHRLVKLADGALPLELAGHVHRHEAMRVLPDEARVVAAVDGVVLPGVGARAAPEAVGAEARGGERLDAVGVAEGNDAAV